MLRLLGRLIVATAVLAFGSIGVQAQNAFPTPAGSSANGVVNMCPSAANPLLFVPCDTTNPLAVNATVSATITFPTFGAAFPATGIAVGFSQGGNLVGATGTAGNLNVNCQVGCSGGSASNASSGVATSSANGTTNAWLYGFNGTTWDQLRAGAGTSTFALRVTQGSDSPEIAALGAIGDTAWSSGNGSIIAIAKTIAGNTGAAIPAGGALIGDVNVRQGGTALSATNGGFTNILQGNAALSATNGLFANQLQGNAVLSATNGTFANMLQGNAVLSTTNPLPTLHVGTAYETVAASQTAQAMGATGAAGDYLSHCIVYPTTTTPGVVTVFDGTSTAGNNVIAFPGGASSVSNLVPFAFPVGAISLNSGGWKVTTGANLVVTCYGRFT